MDGQSSGIATTKLVALTTCGVCCKAFNDPKILPCIHTLCAKCLKQAAIKTITSAGNQMPCPLCGEMFQFPKNGLYGLPNDLFIRRLTDLRMITESPSIQSPCQSCDDEGEQHKTFATAYCVECDMNLCKQCLQHHKKSKLTSGHVLVMGGRESGSTNLKYWRKVSCKKHRNEELKMFCSDCRKATCPYCFIETHKDHSGSPLKTTAEEGKTQIRTKVNGLAVCVAEVKDRKQMLQKSNKSIDECFKELEQEVYRRKSNLIDQIDKHAEQILAKIRERQGNTIKDLSAQSVEIERHLLNLEGFRNYCASILEFGAYHEICLIESNLQSRASELKNHNDVIMKSKMSDDYKIDCKQLEDFSTSSESNEILYLRDGFEDASWRPFDNTEVVKQLLGHNAEMERKIEENECRISDLKTQIDHRQQELITERQSNETIQKENVNLMNDLERQQMECLQHLEDMENFQKEFSSKEAKMKKTIEKLKQAIDTEKAQAVAEVTKYVELTEEIKRHKGIHDLHETWEDLKCDMLEHIAVKCKLQQILAQESQLTMEIKNLRQNLEEKQNELEAKSQISNNVIYAIQDEHRQAHTELREKQEEATALQVILLELHHELKKERNEKIDLIRYLTDALRQEIMISDLQNALTTRESQNPDTLMEISEVAAKDELVIQFNRLLTKLNHQNTLIKNLQQQHAAFRSHLSVTFFLVLFIGFILCYILEVMSVARRFNM